MGAIIAQEREHIVVIFRRNRFMTDNPTVNQPIGQAQQRFEAVELHAGEVRNVLVGEGREQHVHFAETTPLSAEIQLFPPCLDVANLHHEPLIARGLASAKVFAFGPNGRIEGAEKRS